MKSILIFFALLFISLSLQQTLAPDTNVDVVPTAATTPGTAGQQECPYPPLFGEVPSRFNVFIWQDFMTTDAEIGGRLAVGGDAEFLGLVNVGTNLPLEICPAEGGQGNDTAVPPSNATETEWFDNIIVGGMLTWSNGQLATGNIVVGENSNISETVLSGLQQPCSLKINATRLNFTAWDEYLENLSARLAALSATNGQAQLQNGALVIPSDDITGDIASRQAPADNAGDQLQVVDINSPDLLSATTVTLGTPQIQSTTPVVPTTPATVPPSEPSGNTYSVRQVGTAPTTPAGTGTSGQTEKRKVWIFNVRGTPCGFNNAQLQDFQALSPYIVWNFVDCQNLTISTTDPAGIPGSILAPNAAVNGENGLLNGQLFALSYNGSLDFNNTLFEGCVQLLQNQTLGTAETANQGTAIPDTNQQPQPSVVARYIPFWDGFGDNQDNENSGAVLASLGYLTLLLMAATVL